MPESTRSRECSHAKDSDALFAQSKRICIPIERAEYEQILGDRAAFRKYLDDQIAQHPELFPATIQQGYQLHDTLPPSKKMPDLRLRRIKVRTTEDKEEVFSVAPAFVMPYMTGYTDEIEKALFLRRFGVPFWGLTYVFGHDDLYWERLELRIGRNSLVGTTIKHAEHLPTDVLADEKHTRLNGEKVYVATTVGNDCVLGASVALQADVDGLKEAYGHFKTEAQNLRADYQPQTVNTDGWKGTQAAWQNLFPAITVILCFLHAFLKIRDCCKRMKEHFPAICTRVWEVYRAANQDLFMEKVGELKDWAARTIGPGAGLDAILKLCERAPAYALAYAYPSAYRTSNMLDRHMERMDRCFYSARYFHGHLMTAEYAVRGWALLHNFLPYCPRSRSASEYQSPAHKLNGFVYHDNWLQNLLVSASMGGYRQ
jgi:hypothetical protein